MAKSLVVFYSRKGENHMPGAVIAEGLSVRGHQVKDSRAEIAAWAKRMTE